MIFLFEYDRKRGAVCKFKRFASHERAQAQRERLEIELGLHKDRVAHEAVLLEPGPVLRDSGLRGQGLRPIQRAR